MGVAGPGKEEAVAELSARYGLEMRPESLPELVERFGVWLGEPIGGGWVPRG